MENTLMLILVGVAVITSMYGLIITLSSETTDQDIENDIKRNNEYQIKNKLN